MSNCSRNKPFYWGSVVGKKRRHSWWCTSIRQYFVHRKNEFLRCLPELFHFYKRLNVLQYSSLIYSSVRSSRLVHQQTRIFSIIALMVFHAILEFVRGNMEPCHWKLDRVMIRSTCKQQTKKYFIPVWIFFSVFRNYCAIDFPGCEIKAENFQATFFFSLA